MLKIILASIALLLTTSIPTAFAGGGLVSFDVNPSTSLNPGEQYIVRPTVYQDNQGNLCKFCITNIRFDHPYDSDYVSQSSDKTDENGTLYAKVISKIGGPRLIDATITLPNGQIYQSSKYQLNYLNPQNHIEWRTNRAFLKSDNFYITLNGEKYGQSINLSSLNSQPNDLENTTLEVLWSEKGRDIGLDFYFTRKLGEFWKLTAIKSYFGDNGKIINYTATDKFGQTIQNELGLSYKNSADSLEFKSTEDSYAQSVIHLENTEIQAFTESYDMTPTPYTYNENVTSAPTPIYNSDQRLIKRVENLENELKKTQQKQSALESLIQNIIHRLQSIFSFWK